MMVDLRGRCACQLTWASIPLSALCHVRVESRRTAYPSQHFDEGCCRSMPAITWHHVATHQDPILISSLSPQWQPSESALRAKLLPLRLSTTASSSQRANVKVRSRGTQASKSLRVRLSRSESGFSGPGSRLRCLSGVFQRQAFCALVRATLMSMLSTSAGCVGTATGRCGPMKVQGSAAFQECAAASTSGM